MKQILSPAFPNKIHLVIWLILGCGLIGFSDVRAIGFLLPNQDAEAIARGNAFGHHGREWHWALAGQIIAGEPRQITAAAGNSNPFTSATSAGSYQLFIPTVTLSVTYTF